MDGAAPAGAEVAVVDPRGNFLGRGFHSPKSAIPLRLLTRDPEVPLDGAFFRDRLRRALALREALGLPSSETTGYRVVHAEGDGLPGLIVDRFDDVLVVQLLTIGMKQRQGMLFDALDELLSPRAIVDRTPANMARLEGFDPASGVVVGDGSLAELTFRERGFAYRVPLELAQKTGFYFDQRPLRERVESLAAGRRVLDTFSFVGPFALAAARAGAASVTAVDESATAVAAGKRCAEENGLGGAIEFVTRDARRLLQESTGVHDLVIVDPPRLSPTKGSRENALLAYARLAESGCRATAPGGLLLLCSCSAAVDLGSLTRALATGALRAGAQAVVLERGFQGPDHPVPAPFPEGLYLKAILARVDPR